MITAYEEKDRQSIPICAMKYLPISLSLREMLRKKSKSNWKVFYMCRLQRSYHKFNKTSCLVKRVVPHKNL